LRDLCALYTVHGGQFVHYQEHLGRGKALEAVWLRE
jgi:hypothetical protein